MVFIKNKKYLNPRINSRKIKLYYYSSNINDSFFGDWEIIQGVMAKGSPPSKSDYRLKKNIRVCNDLSDKIQKMRVVSFNWNHEAKKYGLSPHKKNIGLIAQEVEKLLPEVISEDKDGYKEIDYGKLTALIIFAMRKLQRNNIELELRMEQMKHILNSTPTN